jgi:KUP system potassium uptake protein
MSVRASARSVGTSRQVAEQAPSKLLLATLGVVFGDIGTSPLYALRTCFQSQAGIGVTADTVLGLLSLIFWSLILIISIKYVGVMLRADNRGEGGVLSLSTLLSAASRNWRIWSPVSAVGLFGAALFFGDGLITPAVSVLSAVEGLAIFEPDMHGFVLPGAVLLTTGLFVAQRRGSGAVGQLFGPIMLVWFTTLALLGLSWITRNPKVVAAINPAYAVEFLVSHEAASFIVLSSVFLCVTGGEALYADMGHFGREPIRRVWFMIVLPALVLNYFGQGALLLHDPTAARNPFYLMAPSWLLPALILLATTATVVASQAMISGVFSITRQALNLGYLPRLRILHSSEHEIAQVYVPVVNWLLFVGVLGLILGFRDSNALAGAYGIAISTTMVIDSALVIMLIYIQRWRNFRALIGLMAVIFFVELAFFSSNLLHVDDGGWITVGAAAVAYLLMSTWHEGRRTLNWLIAKEQVPTRDFLAEIEKQKPVRVPGTAVYLASEASGIPRSLMYNLRFNRVLHERIVFLTFVQPEVPYVPPEERVEALSIAPGIERVIARYGYMETPNTIAALRAADEVGVAYKPDETVYVVGRENPVLARGGGMPMWRKRLFAMMSRNSQLASIHYGLPTHRVLEIGTQVKM